MWEARAEYADGTVIEKNFPYYENGDYCLENKRQYEIETWLLLAHERCVWYSVDYIEE